MPLYRSAICVLFQRSIYGLFSALFDDSVIACQFVQNKFICAITYVLINRLQRMLSALSSRKSMLRKRLSIMYGIDNFKVFYEKLGNKAESTYESTINLMNIDSENWVSFLYLWKWKWMLRWLTKQSRLDYRKLPGKS